MKIIILIDEKEMQPITYFGSILLLLKEVAAQHSLKYIESKRIRFLKKNLPENFILTIVKQEKNSFILNFFFKIQLGFLIRNIKPAIFIHPDSSAFYSTRNLLIIDDFSFTKTKKTLIKSLNNANEVATFSNAIKEKLESMFLEKKKVIQIMYPSVKAILQPVSEDGKALIKIKYTEGKEYFITAFPSNENELIHILKSFSVFKKWQQSNMKMVLLNFYNHNSSFYDEKISSYKYRSDVILMNNVEENIAADLLASAYGFINFLKEENMIVLPANALQCGIPVITFNTISAKEIFGEAALYAEEAMPKNFGTLMVELYKNENLRTEMIKQANAKSELFNIKKNAAQLWQLINSAP